MGVVGEPIPDSRSLPCCVGGNLSGVDFQEKHNIQWGRGPQCHFLGSCHVPGADHTPYTVPLTLIHGLLKKELLSPLSWDSDLTLLPQRRQNALEERLRT